LNITGLLSHQRKLPVNTKYIGILSRFGISEITQLNNKKYDILVILSGPEPQRSIFEKILVNQILESNYKTLIVQGKILKQNRFYHSNIEFVNHLSTAQLQQYIIETPVIICRSGYSSIMDLIVLKKRAILVPTPGQTEQEYLAKLMLEKKWFYSVSQKKIELKAAIEPLNNYYPQKLPVEKNLLEEIIIALKLSVEK
jgi:predicted glycosyltransferase